MLTFLKPSSPNSHLPKCPLVLLMQAMNAAKRCPKNSKIRSCYEVFHFAKFNFLSLMLSADVVGMRAEVMERSGRGGNWSVRTRMITLGLE